MEKPRPGAGKGVLVVGWLLLVERGSAASAVVSHSSAMAEFYLLDLKETRQHFWFPEKKGCIPAVYHLTNI
jgi:hypothetical protein